MLIEDLDNYELKPLRDVAFLIKKLDNDNHHFGSGTNTIDEQGHIHFFQGGEYGKANTIVVAPPLFNSSNIAFNFELQVAMKSIELPITEDKLSSMLVRVYPKDIQVELFHMAKNVGQENKNILKKYINR